MIDRRWFVPTSGMTILDPLTRQPVPAEGKFVAASDEYFLRRVADGGGRFDSPPGEEPALQS